MHRYLRLALAACSALLPTLVSPALAVPPAAPLHSRGQGGAVASADPLATAVGLEILRAGGNAVDSAVATALALAVVFPQAGNLGGGGLAVLRVDGRLRALDFRETAPAAARADMFLDETGAPRKDASLVGPLAAGVPGSPAGLFVLHKAHGRLPWPQVVAPAIRLARQGFAVSPRLAAALADKQGHLARFPETRVVWLPGIRPPGVGSRVELPRLADTLAAYAGHGPSAILQGPLAEAVERTSRRHGGVLRASDLAAYRPVWREPQRFRLADWEVASMPLPSSGGLILAESSAILGPAGWARERARSAVRAHRLGEALRRAYADRYLLGDPGFVAADIPGLLDPARLAARARGIGVRATPSHEVAPAGALEAAREPEHTTHLSVVDREGNAVALTTTLNDSFGSGLLVPEAGFLLNNEMDDFTTAPGRPNLYGLIQGQANAIEPGKRMLSSMSPTLAWRGEELLAVGSPGGSRIPTAVLQVLLSVCVDGERLDRAIAAPRIHHQWLPDRLYYEPGALDEVEREDLRGRGHELSEVSAATTPRALGEVHGVRASRGAVEAAADPRGPGAAGVVTLEAPAR